MEPHAPTWIPIAIAVGSVVVVPAVVWTIRRIGDAWHRHRVEVLGEVFVEKEDVERQFNELRSVQTRQHAENKAALEVLRLEGKEREGRLVGLMDTGRKDHRDEARQLVSGLNEVHRRVDDVLKMLGDRRSRE